jgi:16S rRNA (cytosine1402-N4)-methyltransferase
LLLEKGISSVNGIIADLGLSSYQLDTPERGFSFRFTDEAPLDMRMDRGEPTTAADLVNHLSERELADLIFAFGEERAARRIARRIVQARTKAPLRTTKQLADLVVAVVHPKGHWKIHPATKTFQALRIAVNRELEGLGQFVADAIDLLARDARLVVITFHSLEDRLIKQALKFQSGHCVCPPQLPDCRCGTARRVELLTSKPAQPRESEVLTNPRARSAKLRACRKL